MPSILCHGLPPIIIVSNACQNRKPSQMHTKGTHILNPNGCNLRINLGDTTLLYKTKCANQNTTVVDILLYSVYDKGIKLIDEMAMGILEV